MKRRTQRGWGRGGGNLLPSLLHSHFQSWKNDQGAWQSGVGGGPWLGESGVADWPPPLPLPLASGPPPPPPLPRPWLWRGGVPPSLPLSLPSCHIKASCPFLC